MRDRAPHIPFALDVESGLWIRADRAMPHPPPGRYQCLDPDCRSDLTTAQSKRGRRHFKHLRGSRDGRCAWHHRKGGETIHNMAQSYLCSLFSYALERRSPLPCLEFSTPAGVQTVLMFLPARQVVREWTCPRTGRRPDIALLDGEGQPLLLIEILHTHAVDNIKSDDLRHYWWIEVSAEDILENPTRLRVRAFGNLPDEFHLQGEQFELFVNAPYL